MTLKITKTISILSELFYRECIDFIKFLLKNENGIQSNQNASLTSIQ